jgi:hypothetical protein
VVIALIVCQCYIVLFIALHDWVPLGRLNNLGGIRSSDSTGKLLWTTGLSTLPFAVCLVASIDHVSSRFPSWLWWLLWITYGAGCCGMLRAWWLPYLVIEDPARAARYRARFAHTHAFLPERHGIRPDTLHVTFHAVLVSATILLAVLSAQQA